MKKYFITTLIVISACGGSSEIVTTESTTTTSSTSTTTTVPITTTMTLSEDVTELIMSLPVIDFEDCSEKQLKVGEIYPLVVNIGSSTADLKEVFIQIDDESSGVSEYTFIEDDVAKKGQVRTYSLNLEMLDYESDYTIFITAYAVDVEGNQDGKVCSIVVVTSTSSTTTTSTTTTTVADSTTTSTTTTTVVSVDYPQLIISEISLSIPAYDRDDWNHWIDENGDCQNTRHEVLIEESFETVTYTSDIFCSVSTGKWYGSYTGQYYYNASELDIDHFIPLKNAHQSGGYDWSSAKKEEFANYRLDPDNLIAVNLSANRSKGAKGPDEWKPSNTEYWCEYAYDWIRIKNYWNLTATQAEWDALVSMIETCPAGFAYADAEEEPVVELPTPTTTTTTTTSTTTIASSQPDNPGNTKNCGDFSNYSEAKTWFDTYYPYYGDVGDLDRDGDLIPCESLPGAP